jgi:hypothetical protein
VPPRAAWQLSLYPTAGEAGGCFRAPRQPVRDWVPGRPAADPERARSEAARRARAKVRRYCAGNLLNRFGTLTYAGRGCHDPAQLRTDLADFFRALRTALGGQSLPYVWVPEWHKTDHGLHAHFALNRFVGWRLIRATWGHGNISIKLLSDLPAGSSKREEARRAAGYLSKYVSKTFDAPHLFGRHRYDVAQGFQPTVRRLTGRSADDVLDQACAVMDSEPIRSWSSAQVEDWDRPPAVWFAWA